MKSCTNELLYTYYSLHVKDTMWFKVVISYQIYQKETYCLKMLHVVKYHNAMSQVLGSNKRRSGFSLL